MAQARLTDDQVLFKTTDNKIEITTKAGFHLNAEAPATATFDAMEALTKPMTKTEKLFVFQAPPKAKKAKLSFYVCDDKKTACEQHQKDLVLSAGASTEKIKASTEVASAAQDEKIATVASSDKPTLLIFSAPWCPACIRMHTEVYNQKNVQAIFKKVEIKEINIDLPENVQLSDKYHVKAIPTLILVNQQNQEVTRWLDYQPAGLFAKQLGEKIKNSAALAELEKKAVLGDAAAISAMGMNAYNALNCEEAIKWFSLSKKIVDLDYKLAAEVSCAEDKDQTEQLGALQKAITMTLSKMDKYRWTTDWIEKLKEQKALSDQAKIKAKATIEIFSELLKDDKALSEAFADSTAGEVGRYAKEEVLLMKARLQAALDQEKEQKETFKAVIQQVHKKTYTTDKPGEMLLGIAYLKEAGEKETVEKMYQQLLTKYPNTYVYHEKHARFLLKEKNLEPALSEVDTALKYTEGNEPQLYLLKANIFSAMKDKKSAISILDQALAFDKISHQKYKKTLASIEKLKKELNSDTN